MPRPREDCYSPSSLLSHAKILRLSSNARSGNARGPGVTPARGAAGRAHPQPQRQDDGRDRPVLAGASPLVAVRHQIVLMLMLTAAAPSPACSSSRWLSAGITPRPTSSGATWGGPEATEANLQFLRSPASGFGTGNLGFEKGLHALHDLRDSRFLGMGQISGNEEFRFFGDLVWWSELPFIARN